jgi:hypothetical protein
MTASNKSLTTEQQALLAPLIRQEPWKLFQSDSGPIYSFWSTLVLETSVADTTATITDVQNVLRIVDGIISDESRPYWQHRLAYLQLTRILASLMSIIKRHRMNGQLNGQQGQDNSTLLLNTYMAALEKRRSRREINHRIRLAKRWSRMIRGSMFLAVAYSRKVETMMYVR